jgi:hypothetical protein
VAGVPPEWFPEAIVLPGLLEGSLFRGMCGGGLGRRRVYSPHQRHPGMCHKRERKRNGGNPSLGETGHQEPLSNE